MNSSSTLLPLTSFKEQFDFAPEISHEEKLRTHTNVIICGMGGSAICVSLLKMLFPELLVTLHNSYGLPISYDKTNTLIILNSYSGNTEEILDIFERATKEQLQIAALSCGGKLLDKAESAAIPYVQIPPSDLEPRFSIGYQMIGLLSLMGEYEKIKLLQEKIHLVQIEKSENEGKLLSEAIGTKYPIIYASSQFYPVAYLIKAAINEGAKTPSFVNIIPEANHNELQSFVTDNARDEHNNFAFIFMRSTYDHQRVTRRFGIMKELYTSKEFMVSDMEKDTTNITTVFETILTGYFLATYIAIAKNVDPYKTPFIQTFKGRMSE